MRRLDKQRCGVREQQGSDERVGQSANATGVEGYNNAVGYGMIGLAQGGGNYGVGVLGESFGTGLFPNGNGSDGVDGFAHSTNGSGVAGLNYSGGPGIYGYSASGAAGVFDGNVTVAGNVLANGGGGQSTYGSGAFITKSVTILGDVTIGGALVVEGNKYGFFIDHPLDPAHKYLSHRHRIARAKNHVRRSSDSGQQGRSLGPAARLV